MKQMAVLLAILTLFSGCGIYKLNKWSPQVNMSEAELIEHWGQSYDCASHVSIYGASKQCWYSMEPITGLIFGSYTAPSDPLPMMNVLIQTEKGMITSIYFP